MTDAERILELLSLPGWPVLLREVFLKKYVTLAKANLSDPNRSEKDYSNTVVQLRVIREILRTIYSLADETIPESVTRVIGQP